MSKILIGKVYANWCGHCISLKPEWKRMKSHIKKNYKNIEFIEAEVSEINKIENLKRKHNIVAKGYPTLFKIRESGEIEYYKGPRQTNDLIHWASGNGKNYMGGKGGGKSRRKKDKKNVKKNAKKTTMKKR
jgi:thiol-disulfide isomerase/thioredoxin